MYRVGLTYRFGLSAALALLVFPDAAAAQNTPRVQPLRPIQPITIKPAQTQVRGPFASRQSDSPRGGPDEIVPPARVPAPTAPAQINLKTHIVRPSPVLLRGGSFRQQTATTRGARGTNMNLASLRANPVFNLGNTRVDMRPLLNNSKSLINVSARLQAMPKLVRVNVQSLETVTLPRGMAVRSFVNYTLMPGTCSDPERRAQIAAAGIRCATQTTDAERIAAFSKPGSDHYVPDPALRAKAIAEAKAGAAKDAAALAADVGALRADLKDPARRAELAASIGAAELARLDGLDDTGLAAEIVNSGDTKIEEVAYVPKEPSVASAEASTPQKLDLVPPPPPGDLKQDFSLGTLYYLAGFTLGREYEWRQRVEKTINRCLIGCAKTYYVEIYAGFNYGLGLRVPIELTGNYTYSQNGATGAETGTVATNFKPIDGSPAQYLAAGLPQEKLFGGKEFVAQFGAYAGFGADLPFYPTLNVRVDAGVDFTDYLPGAFKGGNFTPPDPNGPGLEIPFVLYDVDLIGGQGNFGIVGAQVFPAAKLTLKSEKLNMVLVDHNHGDAPITLKAGGQSTGLSLNPNTRAAQFAIKDPTYNLNFAIEPGINARLFIDIGVWGHNWDFPVYFPSLAISLGGADFACHQGTTCSREFNFAPDPKQAASINLARWANKFETVWLKQCTDDQCQKSIRFVRLANQAVFAVKLKEFGANPPANLDNDPFFKPKFAAANEEAMKIVWLNRQRKFVADFEGGYPPNCQDKLCGTVTNAIKTLALSDLKKMIDAPPPASGIDLRDTFFSSRIETAKQEGAAAVAESQFRTSAGPAAQYGMTSPAELAKQCVDKQCVTEMGYIALLIKPRGAQLVAENQGKTIATISKTMHAEFDPQFAKAVADAKIRAKNAEIK